MNKTYLEPTRQPKPRLSAANSLPASIFDYKKPNYAKVRADKNRQLGFNSVQNVDEKSPSKQIHITYLHTDPDLHPRTRKIKDTFEKYGFKFVVFKPRFRVNLKNRSLSAGINYFLFFWETLYIPGDILWVANCPDTVGIGPWLTRRKYIYDYRSHWSKEIEIEIGTGIFSKLAGIIERTVRRGASVIVLTSSANVRSVQNLRKPIFIVPNYPLENFLPTRDRESFRSSLGTNPDTNVILYISKLSRVEGTDMLKNIVKDISFMNNIELWIVGDGRLSQLVEDISQKYGKIIRFFGWVDYSEIPNFVNAADVCIVPRHPGPFADTYNEEGIQKISEYLNLGKPVVACNIAPSDKYILVTEDTFAEGIKKALNGPTPKTSKRTWESYSAPVLLQVISTILEKKEVANK